MERNATPCAKRHSMRSVVISPGEGWIYVASQENFLISHNQPSSIEIHNLIPLPLGKEWDRHRFRRNGSPDGPHSEFGLDAQTVVDERHLL